MVRQIVLFGATGYTGTLTAEKLVAHGQRPLLAGRDATKLAALAERLGSLPYAQADIGAPESIAALLSRGDALISTVGPYSKLGSAAVESAIAMGAHYFDCSSDGSFTRRMLAEWGPAGEASGSVLVSSMGAFSSTTNLAGAQALDAAGPGATTIEVGFFMTGTPIQSMGSAATAALSGEERNFAFQEGRMRDASIGPGPVFVIDGQAVPTLTLSSTDHIFLPRLYPNLRQVFWGAGLHGNPGGIANPGPDAGQRAVFRSLVVARALDAAGGVLAEIRLEGPCGYDITADMLGWAARQAVQTGFERAGWLGPLGAFGKTRLEQGLREAGLVPAPPGYLASAGVVSTIDQQRMAGDVGGGIRAEK